MRNVNNILRRNRRILLELEPYGKTRISKLSLIGRGFNFDYFTSMESTRLGKCFFCYEYGYLPVDNEQFALIKKRENSGFEIEMRNHGPVPETLEAGSFANLADASP